MYKMKRIRPFSASKPILLNVMIKKHLFKVCFILLLYGFSINTTVLSAHEVGFKHSLDFSYANSFNNGNALALSLLSTKQFVFSEKFHLGLGLRFTSNSTKGKPFVTAPAKVSEGNFFKKQNEEKLDTLYLNKGKTNSLNLAIYLAYDISNKLAIELNIDAIGFSFGANQRGSYQARSQNYPITEETAKVTPFNILLTGDYDIGSLNSEFTLNYKITDQFSIRPGVSFLFSEYTTDRKLAFNNDRFRNKSLLPVLGLRYRFK
jgi:hypothetical protein